jgi:hypothetical protein
MAAILQHSPDSGAILRPAMTFLHRNLGTLAVASSFILFAGCSSDDSGGDTGGTGGSFGGAGGSGADAGSAGSAGTGGSGGQKCPAPGNSADDTPQQIDALTARIIDLDGNGAPKIHATVCGTDICIYGSTDDQGMVVTCDDQLGVCSPGIEPKQVIKTPAFKFALGIDYVKWAYRLPPGAVHVIGDFTTAKLPAIATGEEIVAGGEASSNGITLSVAAGASIKHDTLVYEVEEQWRFRAVEIPIANAPPAVDTALGFELLIGTTPVETHFCPLAKLSVPNSAGWAAGTEVEFFAHGVDPLGEWAPYGGWAKVSGGAVSSDGSSVVTHDGEGIPLLTVFGIRKK